MTRGASPQGFAAAEHSPGRAPVRRLRAQAFRVPTDAPESDGTLEWDATTLVLVEVEAGGSTGIGYTYAHAALVRLIDDEFRALLRGRDAMDVPGCREAMLRAVRNLGRPGLCSMAIAAVDLALWDLKARLLGLPLASLLGMRRERVPVYGSSGFTSWDIDRLCSWLAGCFESGIPRVKMKVGRDPAADVRRVRAAREAIGREAELFVDANGAYDRKQALAMAGAFAAQGVSWFEEPVPSTDVDGLRLLRERAPDGMEIAAGEYGYAPDDFKRLLDAGAVDVLQVDVTRCGGITGFLEAAVLADAFEVPISSHTAPAAHLAACCAAPGVRHMEYFHDHVRIERALFDGAPEPAGGCLAPALDRPGSGLEFRHADAAAYRQ